MKRSSRPKRRISVASMLSVCLMIFCLTFLTTLNYFLYPSDGEVITKNANPSGPTEEKSGNSSFSFAEEILHENSFEFSSDLTDQLCLHHIAEADRLQIFHPELILRPPRA